VTKRQGGKRRHPILRACAWGGAAVVIVGAAYGAGDAYDVLPGPLTTQPALLLDPLPEPTPSIEQAAAPRALADDAPVPANLAKLIGGMKSDKAMTGKFGAEVRDALSGKVLYSTAADSQKTPASVTKVLTGTAALGVLGGETRFTTSVELTGGPAAKATSGAEAAGASGAQPHLYLVAGGDVMLGAGASDAGSVMGRAGLASLAEQTAAQLKKQGVKKAAVSVDLSRYSGPRFSSAWSRADMATGAINPITPLMLSAGKTGAGEYAPRMADPVTPALKAFTTALDKHGIATTPAKPRTAPQGAERVAAATSASVAEQTRYMLENSDNVMAEVLGVEVAKKMGKGDSIDDGPAGVIAALAQLRVETGSIHLGDTSGLDYSNRISPHEMADVVRTVATSRGDLSQLIPSLPVGGLSGTLAERYRDPASKDGAGKVSAKTGTLSTVTSLAGTVVTKDGRLLAFAFMADGIKPGSADAVRKLYDANVTKLADCGCS
jgi:D-alanyl-D-alanine carboxypeptidase/D-alanyl-D-alanine-endopeptidase (penicillin-binding protein 4)